MEYMPTLTMLVGISGAGKSTFVHKFTPYADILSSDDLRMELYGDVNDQEHNTEVFTELHRRCKELLRKGRSVCLDCTNISRKKRMAFLRELKNIRCKKVCILIAVPFQICCARNFARERQVPVEHLERMYKNFNVPAYAEGWDKIQISFGDYDKLPGFEFDYKTDLDRWKSIKHDNPNHTLTIGEHIETAAYLYMKSCEGKQLLNEHIFRALMLHDCGKPEVKSYYNGKGEFDPNHAHYYNHQNIGSYLSLFYLRNMKPEWDDKDILYTALLIELHMNPFIKWRDSDKAKKKDEKLFGEECIKHIEEINFFDIAAH